MDKYDDGCQWLFFDLGSTLIDETGPEENRAVQFMQLARERGKELTLGQIRQYVAEAAAEHAPNIIVGAVTKAFGATEVSIRLAQSIDYNHCYESPYPSARDVLARLRGRYRIGVIANQNFGAGDRLARYGLSPYIDLLVSSAEEGLRKPDPAIFKLALGRAACRPEQAMMVGDRLDNDIRPAKQLRMGTVWVRQGYHGLAEPRDDREKPDFIIDRIDELPGLLLD